MGNIEWQDQQADVHAKDEEEDKVKRKQKPVMLGLATKGIRAFFSRTTDTSAPNTKLYKSPFGTLFASS